jgi:hypothetical protein
LRYIGSTTKTPQQRLKGHEQSYRQYKRGKYPFITSFKVLCNGDYDISIVETVEVSSIKELRQIEGRHIKAFNSMKKYNVNVAVCYPEYIYQDTVKHQSISN